MKILSKILLSTIFLVIAGCSTTPQEMRADAREKGVVQVDLPFNVVRENILRNAKKCYYGGINASYLTHEIKDVKPGELTTLDIVQRGAASIVRVIFSFDIRKSSTSGTEVSYYVAGLIVPNLQAVFESWAKGQDGKCR